MGGIGLNSPVGRKDAGLPSPVRIDLGAFWCQSELTPVYLSVCLNYIFYFHSCKPYLFVSFFIIFYSPLYYFELSGYF